MKNNLIYIVEDDESIRELESFAMINSGFEVMSFEDCKGFYNELKNNIPSLIILDIMLPETDGLKILKRIKEINEYSQIPVIIVTAKSAEIDAVKALDRGADDYIKKPFGVMELVSRVKAVIRRTHYNDNAKKLSYREITIDEEKHKVCANGNVIGLTYKEYEILKLLIANSGIVFTRDRLMESIWGYDFQQGNRTVDVHILSLRKKLGEYGDYIKTIVNVGYKIGE